MYGLLGSDKEISWSSEASWRLQPLFAWPWSWEYPLAKRFLGKTLRAHNSVCAQRFKKASEKVLGRVLGKGFQKGSEKRGLLLRVLRRVLRMGSEKGVPRTPPQRLRALGRVPKDFLRASKTGFWRARSIQGNEWNIVSRVLFRKRELGELCGKLGEFCEKLGEFVLTHKWWTERNSLSSLPGTRSGPKNRRRTEQAKANLDPRVGPRVAPRVDPRERPRERPRQDPRGLISLFSALRGLPRKLPRRRPRKCPRKCPVKSTIMDRSKRGPPRSLTIRGLWGTSRGDWFWGDSGSWANFFLKALTTHTPLTKGVKVHPFK